MSYRNFFPWIFDIWKCKQHSRQHRIFVWIVHSIYCSILDRKDSCRVSVTPCLLSPFIYHHFSFSRHHHYIRFYYIENVGEKSSWELVPFTYILQLCIERLSSYLLASNSSESSFRKVYWCRDWCKKILLAQK